MTSANLQTEKIKANLELLAYKLESLNPQVQLERGYAIILDEAKNIQKALNCGLTLDELFEKRT